ncbi:hypothetical protein DRO66_00560 [Candidatus Bathyarchaeota archaeon]|nr:MAG: hypothetical protein DRO66_00560 [Candidatus Bathyarchaeota archaeon]
MSIDQCPVAECKHNIQGWKCDRGEISTCFLRSTVLEQQRVFAVSEKVEELKKLMPGWRIPGHLRAYQDIAASALLEMEEENL